MKKVVIDTSVWVAAILSNTGASYEIFKKCLDGQIDVVISHSMYDEFARVIERPSILKMGMLEEGEIKKLKYFLKRLKKPVEEKIKIVRDSEDDMFVNCALSFEVNMIVTLDKDLLDIAEYKGIIFLKPGDFLKKYRKELYDKNAKN